MSETFGTRLKQFAFSVDVVDEGVLNQMCRLLYGETPTASAPATPGSRKRLRLLYKEFGIGMTTPLGSAFVLASVAEIVKDVYGVRQPRKHACYRRVQNSWSELSDLRGDSLRT